MITGPESEGLPDASELIAELQDRLARGGKLFDDAPIPPESPISPSRYDKKYYVSTFLINYFPTMPIDTPRSLAGKLFEDFPPIVDRFIGSLESRGRRNEADILKSITLGDLAKFAQDEHEKFARASGQASINSPQVEDLRSQAEYWSRVEQISRAASELEGR